MILNIVLNTLLVDILMNKNFNIVNLIFIKMIVKNFFIYYTCIYSLFYNLYIEVILIFIIYYVILYDNSINLKIYKILFIVFH